METAALMGPADFVLYNTGAILKKDFIAPNALGWETVCLLDDGWNIHKQEFDAGADEMRARKVARGVEGAGVI